MAVWFVKLKQDVEMIDVVYLITTGTYALLQQELAIGLTLQKSMAKNANITRTYSLPTSHTPFFSEPTVVASILGQEAK